MDKLEKEVLPRYETEPRYPLFIPEAESFLERKIAKDNKSITPKDIFKMHAFGKSGKSGKGVCIAVIGAYKNEDIKEEFDTYGKTFSLNKNTLEVYYPQGKSDVYNSAWALEATADVELLYALAQNARIMCVFAKDAGLSSLFSAVKNAVDLGADIISMSFGVNEFVGEGKYTEYMKNTGKIFIASSGNVGGKVYFPSSSAASVSVGGAEFFEGIIQKSPFAKSEKIKYKVWQNSGGGVSKYEKAPAWQKDFSGVWEKSGVFRATPDVSEYASKKEGYLVYTKKDGFVSVGGTSTAAAVFSGICANILSKYKSKELFNGERFSRFLYELAGKTEYSLLQKYFDDIIYGNNNVYFAEKGYDLASGLGVIKNIF